MTDFIFGDETKKCLAYFDYNQEQVINALLEGNLPDFAAEDNGATT